MHKITVTTSWDDGHLLDLKLARLLNKYHIRGTFYIAPKNREFRNTDLLSDAQIVQLSRDFEIGGHTLTHPVLTKIGLSRAETEIVSGKHYLEQLIGKQVLSFSYPRGSHNPEVQKLVKKHNFLYARTVVRHKFSLSENPLAHPTSVHALNQYQDVLTIARFSRFRFPKFLQNLNWDNLAINYFDSLNPGDIFHFWGHSWIIQREGDWDKLERVLSHISNRRYVKYVTNIGLVS